MSKSYKLSGTGNYIDSTGIIHNKKELPYYLDNLGTLPIGTIIPYASNTKTPAGFLICDGSAVSRTTYADLYAIIGTQYGSGDGSTTFNLPNLKGRIPVGYDSTQSEFNTIGKTGGEKTHTLTESEMPSHNHKLTTVYNAGDWQQYATMSRNPSGTSTGTLTTNTTGGNQAHNNIQPYITIIYLIKASNTYSTLSETKTASIVDSLSSSSAIDALSANQGRILGEQAVGEVLYENSSGTCSTTTLSKSSANYSKIIVITNRNSQWTCCNPHGYSFAIESFSINFPDTDGGFRHFCTTIVFSGNTMSFKKQFFYDHGGYAQEFSGGLTIKKVIGYK